MKRLFLISMILVLFCLPGSILPFRTLNASAAETPAKPVYGLIKDGAYLLNAQKEPVTSLPASYFAVVKSEDAEYYAIDYRNSSGFISKTFIEVVDYEPKTKFHTAYYTAKNDTFPTNIRALPSQSSNVTATIPLNQKAYMYGALDGETLIGATGATWYYVEYNGVAGYAYCAQGSAETIIPNVIERVEEPLDFTPSDNPEFKLEWIYILFVIVASVIIMLSLFSRPKAESESAKL